MPRRQLADEAMQGDRGLRYDFDKRRKAIFANALDCPTQATDRRTA
jgi:hypothetical protein